MTARPIPPGLETLPKETLEYLLASHLANDGEREHALRIKELYSLQTQQEKGQPFDADRLKHLETFFKNEFLIPTQIEKFWHTKNENAEAKNTSQTYHAQLIKYLENFESAPDAALEKAMQNTTDAARRRRQHANRLKQTIRDGKTPWKEQGITPFPEYAYIEKNFPDIVQTSLSETQGLLNNVIRLANRISGKAHDPDPLLAQEYRASMKEIAAYLKAPDSRKDITFADLMHYIDEHRGSTEYRDSTTALYGAAEVLIAKTAHHIPSRERERTDVNTIHNCVDPDFLDLNYTTKLALLNDQHDFGLSQDDIELFGTVLSTIGTVMRGFGINEIDDRVKQYLHNSADHSLRVCILVSSTRDANIKKIEQEFKDGSISTQEKETLITLAKERAKIRIKQACTHDTGEYLGELLGNNLVGKTDKEESVLRSFRDKLEGHIMADIIPQEVETRLKSGPFKANWVNKDPKQLLSAFDDELANDALASPFHDKIFEIFERLQTQHDIISQRAVGRINQEGALENATTASIRDLQYTLRYALSKISGRKFEDDSPDALAELGEKEYNRTRRQDAFNENCRTADELGLARPYRPDVTHPNGIDITPIKFDQFFDESDIIYDKSIFKPLAQKIIERHKNLSPKEAKTEQFYDEMMLHALHDEVLHYVKKQARAPNLDPHKQLDDKKVEKAVRKMFAQGITLMQAHLKEEGLTLTHLKESDFILGKTSYPFASANADTFMGGIFKGPKKNKRIAPLTSVFKFSISAQDFVKKDVIAPAAKIVNTLNVQMARAENKYITADDFRLLMQMAATQESGGDLGFTATGLLEGLKDNPQTANDNSSIDGKVATIINPVLTYTLGKISHQIEGVEKCYGHILNLYHEEIAQKYGLDKNQMELILNRSNLKKGEYHKNPHDETLTADIAEQMFAYFKQQYTSDTQENKDKSFEKAERYILREILEKEKRKQSSRLAQETSPPRQQVFQKRVQALKTAKAQIKNDRLFHLAGKHMMEIRFGFITGLGAAIATSTTGLSLGQVSGVNVTTSTLLGLNLALGSLALYLSATGDKIKKLPENATLKKFFNGLPYFEMREGNLHIIKGKTIRPKEEDFKNLKEAQAALINNTGKKAPDIITQTADAVVAMPTTLIRKFSHAKTGGDILSNQGTFTTLDSGGIAYKAIGSGDPLIGAAQSATAMTTRAFFMRLNILNMWLIEMKKELAKGGTPNPETIRMTVDEQLRENGCEHLINAMNNIGKSCAGTPVGKIGVTIEKAAHIGYTDKAIRWWLKRQHEKKKQARPTLQETDLSL